MIDTKNVTFRYASSEEDTLKDVSLHIENGEFVLLLGASGCGKTTITRLINVLVPDFYEGMLTGDIVIDGKNTAEHTIQELSHTVGSVFQDPRSQFFAMDTTAEIAFSCENAGLKREETVSRIQNAIELFEIEKLLGKSVFELSSGEKQMIAIASVYARQPKVMVFDEPSANLDNNAIDKLKDSLHKLKDQGHTIVVSEHRIHYLKDLCGRVIIIKNGKIDRELSGREFRKQTNESLNRIGLRSIHIDKLPKEKNERKSGEPLLQLKNICFGYKKNNLLLNNVNMDVHRGEILGIVGRNGTGKTTLLEIICGIKKQKKGDIFINGNRYKNKARIKHAYLVMQDSDYQLFTESVEKEIYLGSKKTKGFEEKGVNILARINLSEYIDRHPASLSGGQKQRLCIAVACIKDADIICFDEPTSGLDYQSMVTVDQLLTDLAAQGKAIIVTSHDHEFLSSCCTSIYEMGMKKY